MSNIAQIEAWFAQMERLGEADMPMEIEGQIMTPRQYLQKMRGG
jgi:hypothetical protein